MVDGGSQQFSASRLTFNGCNTAVQIIWDWGWVWKNIVVNKAKVGFRLYNDADKSLPGSITLVDTVFSGTGSVAIEMATPAETKDAGFTGLVLDNVRLDAKINDPFTNKQILASGDYKYVSLVEISALMNFLANYEEPVCDGGNVQG